MNWIKTIQKGGLAALTFAVAYISMNPSTDYESYSSEYLEYDDWIGSCCFNRCGSELVEE